MNLKDIRPYMLQAHIQWLEDSGAVPHLVIQNGTKTLFPAHLSANSLVTFRITKESIRNLNIDDQGLSFSARFSGKEFTVYAPLDCVMQLHSENGKVIIQLQKPTELATEQSESSAVEQSQLHHYAPPVLSTVSGGSGDGTKRGKLSLVPKSNPEPIEPERA